MLAIDKLLKSNELNFQMLALFPAVILVGSTVRLLYGYLFRRVPRALLFVQIRQEMRNLERLVDLNFKLTQHSEAQEDFTAYAAPLQFDGKMLLSLHRIKKQSIGIPKVYQRTFHEDLQDIEFEENRNHRKAIIERMYRYYPMLQPT
eukprot:TRINITY_DN23720_c0_g1_i1.p1 TRINITY_DN23720_c0_g1~~TRINITY_DN23720_c0_g1_i1.p1  ORF type:complete len:147 (+),score=39.73 TRINITY_DN23720_c0_g1_i1:94-534(+)